MGKKETERDSHVELQGKWEEKSRHTKQNGDGCLMIPAGETISHEVEQTAIYSLTLSFSLSLSQSSPTPFSSYLKINNRCVLEV